MGSHTTEVLFVLHLSLFWIL